jgi:putative ABC transport system substrate-binding protein
VKRREFISLLGGAAAAWPLAARAQQPMPVLGLLLGGSAAVLGPQIAAFHEGLRQAGFAEGQNVAVQYRYTEGQLDRFPALASDLVDRGVAVIVAGTPTGALAAKQATRTIPIVFTIGSDPVEMGLVASLNSPGGNLTGVYQFSAGLEPKRLGLLCELVPRATTIAALIHTNYSAAETQVRDVQEGAARLGVQPLIIRTNAESDFKTAFSTIVQQQVGALLVCASPFFNTRRQLLVLMAARYALPAIYEWREFTAAGGLMSYGTVLADAYRQVGLYAGRILKGEKPADLPVVQVTKFEFVINLNTAKALDLEVPPSLLARADEVIE